MPSAYISTYGLYNNGFLTGRWFDLETETDAGEILAEITRLATEAGHAEFVGEELDIQDTEGFDDLNVKGFDLSDLCKIAAEWDSLGLQMQLCQAAHGAHYYMDADALISAAEDVSYSTGSSESDLAWQMADDLGVLNEIPKHLRYYFDAEAWFRDALLNGDGYVVCVGGNYYHVLAA